MKILIVRVSSIGDVIHTLPAIFLLKQMLPAAQISWVVQNKAASLIKDQDFLTRVWILPDNYLSIKNLGETVAVMQEIRTEQWDAIIDFQGLLKTTALLFWLRGKKYGFDSNNTREKITALFTHKHTTPAYTNIIQKNLALASMVIQDLFPSSTCPSITELAKTFYLKISKEKQMLVTNWLIQDSIKKYIVLCPNTTWESKRWPTRHWLELAKKLVAQMPDYHIILMGKDFGSDAKELAYFIKEKQLPVVMLPAWDLITTSYLVQKAALIIAPDTSFLHIADFMGTPALGIFGPTHASKHGPFLSSLNKQNSIQVDCPHHYQKTHHDLDCLNSLSAHSIIEKANKILIEINGRTIK